MARVDLISVQQDDSKWVYGRFDVDAMFGIARELTGAAGIGNCIGIRWIVAVNRVNRKRMVAHQPGASAHRATHA